MMTLCCVVCCMRTLCFIAGGEFRDKQQNAPQQIQGFFIDTQTVSIDDYKKFVAATHYQTQAELLGYSKFLNPQHNFQTNIIIF